MDKDKNELPDLPWEEEPKPKKKVKTKIKLPPITNRDKLEKERKEKPKSEKKGYIPSLKITIIFWISLIFFIIICVFPYDVSNPTVEIDQEIKDIISPKDPKWLEEMRKELTDEEIMEFLKDADN